MALQYMVNELLKLDDLTQERIAKLVKSSQPVIGRISKHGSVPSYTVGKNIEALYEERLGNKIKRSA